MTSNNIPPVPYSALGKDQLRREKLDRGAFRAKTRHPIRVILDGVTQNYNVGAIFRLCDAMLVERLVICGTAVNLRKRKLVQAARGTQNWVPWSECEFAETAVRQARDDGYQVVIAELTAASVAPDDFVGKFPLCLVLGSEFSGVSPEVAALADSAIAIPMHGMANSINVATAGAIILHRLIRLLMEVK